MFTLPTYTAINDGIARIGEVAICTGCLWSPHGGGGAVNDD